MWMVPLRFKKDGLPALKLKIPNSVPFLEQDELDKVKESTQTNGTNTVSSLRNSPWGIILFGDPKIIDYLSSNTTKLKRALKQMGPKR